MPVLPSADWPSFFQLPVLMLMLITLLNDGTLISIGYDRVIPSPRPGEPAPPSVWGLVHMAHCSWHTAHCSWLLPMPPCLLCCACLHLNAPACT